MAFGGGFVQKRSGMGWDGRVKLAEEKRQCQNSKDKSHRSKQDPFHKAQNPYYDAIELM